MHADEIRALFDRQAAGYDKQWAKMAPIPGCLHYLLESVVADLPADSRALCVGAGTGAEMAHLARAFPRWRFTAVDPSSAMIDRCRERSRREEFESRCEFHAGYLDTLPAGEPFDVATSFLVSQFILERRTRVEFFRAIRARLKPGGMLASSDLSADTGSGEYTQLLGAWFRMMSDSGMQPDGVQRMREAYARDVSILPAQEVGAILEDAGFERPVQFFQAGLIRGWFARAG